MHLSKRQIIVLLLSMFLHQVISCDVPESERFKCGYDSVTRKTCLALDCCYDSSATQSSTPKCYYKTRVAAGGPIRHSNGLCVFPKNGKTTELTSLVWSYNCFSKNAMFLVSHDFPTRHIASRKFILSKGDNSDPGVRFPLFLRSSQSNAVKFRRDGDGNLRYFYLQGDYNICLEVNPDPMEGNMVMFAKTACGKLKYCQHLTYVYETGIKSRESGTISCSASSVIQVTWANYGKPLKYPKLGYGATQCTMNKVTNIKQRSCNGGTSCTILVNPFQILKQSCPSYLIVRHTCVQMTKPAAPNPVTLQVLGQTKLNVMWSKSDESRTKDNLNLYIICWKGTNWKCFNESLSTLSKELNKLEPSTQYLVKVASHSCGVVGVFSEVVTAFTRAAPLSLYGENADTNFSIRLGSLQPDDNYIQIIVKKLRNNSPPEESQDSYKNLNSYKEGASLYITAELDRNYVNTNKVFTIGDGKRYRKSRNRKRRDVTYLNAKLKPGTYYSVFQRTFKNNGLYYNSEWMVVVQTANSSDTEIDKDSDNKGVIGGVVGGTIAIILIIFILVLVFIRREGRHRSNSNGVNKPVIFNASHVADNISEREESIPEIQDQPEEPEVFINEVKKIPDVVYAKPDKTKKKKVQEEMDNTYANLTDVNFEELNDVSILIFPSYVEEMKRSKNSGFEKMFKKLHVGQAFPWDISKKPINVEKFRYGNIVTYDHSRVVLSGDESQDYINASFIDGIKPDLYIAAQGPTEKTADDFWRMIWEQDSHSIIALTNVRELGKIKCVQYWPEKESTFGEIYVKMLKIELFADFVIRYLSMHKDGITKEVQQYHFISWPDHGVPKYPTQLLAFRRRFKALHQKGSPPIIVHCSAGVGRTGTFITLDVVLERLEGLHQQIVNIHDTIKELRTRRVNMVQTVEQYIFIHNAVLESLLCGVTEIEAENLKSEIERLEQTDENSLSGFELEFQKLNSVCPQLPVEECELALRKKNQRKNRHPDIYPAENLRVVISGAGRDYINATYVHGYTQSHAYIVTQTPLPDTINDFWGMVYVKKASVVVMLNNLVEGNMQYPQYWPQNVDDEEQYGDLFVKMVSSDVHEPIISRKFTVTSKSQSSPIEHAVRHIQFTDWPEDGVPSDNSNAIVLLETIKEAQQYAPNGVIIVHCSNGAHRTGTYLTLVNQRERIMTEHVLDVFRCIKMMRGQRPQFVGNVDQYKFCYYILLNIVESYKTYDNMPKSTRD